MKETAPVETPLPVRLDLLSASDFMPYSGLDLRINFAAGVQAVAQLEQVLVLPGYSTLERKPFSITLQTEQTSTYYPQAIYEVMHPVLGGLFVFLVPVGVKGKGMQYEAVFS